MWNDLSQQWRTVLEEAWTAFSNNCVPIGAAIFDKSGRLIVKDHNRSGYQTTLNPMTAHAESNTLNRLDCRNGLQVRDVVMYSSMEPCPMCMGAIVMSNIKDLHFGSHDRWCGAVHLLDEDPYFRSQHISVKEPHEEIEFFQLVLSSYHELKYANIGGNSAVIDCFRISSRAAVEAAERLYVRRTLDNLAMQEKNCAEIYDMIIQLKEEQNV